MPCPAAFKNTISGVLHSSEIHGADSVLWCSFYTEVDASMKKKMEESIGDPDNTITQCLNLHFLYKWFLKN